MNQTTVQPERAWQMALGQLQLEMPKAYFDTWVKNTEFLSFNNGLLTIGTANAYAREWLTSRLTSTLSRSLTGILTQPVAVRFVVHEFSPGHEEEVDGEGANDEEIPEKGKPPEVLTLQAEYLTIYDEIVQPEHVIVVPGYFLRYIPMLGVELAWLYVGFRQAAYEAGASKKPGKKVSAPAKKVAWYAGMSPRSFWRWAAKPSTWKLLRWLVKPVGETAKWNRGSDGRPHQATRNYRVAMNMPLTPFDELSLRAWLYRKLSEGTSPIAALQSALDTRFDDLLPWPERMPAMEEIGGEPHSVQEVVQEVCNSVTGDEKTQLNALTEKLAQHLMPSNDLIFLTHYFVSHWLPRLGPGPGWFVTLMRDRCYLNRRTGEIRDEVRFEQGYAEAARLLGLKRVKTIWEWLRSSEVAIFLRETDREIGTWEEAPRRFKVCLGEPMTDKDQDRANDLLAKSLPGASVTHRSPEQFDLIGASCTDSEMKGEFVGASVTHRDHEYPAPIGASCTDIKMNGEAVGATVSHRNPEHPDPIGASCIDSKMNGEAVGASVSHRNPEQTGSIGASCMDSEMNDETVGASVTHRKTIDEDSVGANGVLSEENGDFGVGGSATPSNGSANQQIGASFTHSTTLCPPPIGASCKPDNRQIGASDSHNGATGTHKRGASGTAIGANGTFDWRDWHSLISLTPGFKHLNNTLTIPAANIGLDTLRAVRRNETGVVAGEWKIADLLALNRISAKNQDQLLQKGITAQAFISWLLYAASQSGSSIRDPIGHAVSRLVQDPLNGAGGAYDRLAGLPVNELADLIYRELSFQSPRNTDWRIVMEGTPHTRLRALADQLGLPIPDTNS